MPSEALDDMQGGAAVAARRTLTRRICQRVGILVILLIGGIYAADEYIEYRAHQQVFDSLDLLPHRPVGIVLGTSPYVSTGRKNGYYTARIEAAADLYHRGKVNHLIVSGANPSPYYNEPRFMKADLVNLGVPENKITSDFAGLRTLDSVIRAHKVFGQDTFTIISQRFHLLRAVYIGHRRGLDVVGYAAEDPKTFMRLKARLREYGARAKALLDIWVFDTQPKFLGEKLAIETGRESRLPQARTAD